jgi:hypothetical protein
MANNRSCIVRGCNISAYHYNIVANMMLLTCATHLMSVTIVREYWKYPVLAVLRIIVVTGAFLATGVFLSNQTAAGNRFPTEVPPFDSSDSLMFMRAICFEGDTSLRDTISDSFHRSTSPGNVIHGWNNFIAMLFWYIAAIIAEATRFIYRGQGRPGWRDRVGRKYRENCGFLVRHEIIVVIVFTIYLIGGIAISSWTVATSVQFIMQLRLWVNRSGWMLMPGGKSPEDDATSFGQLIPMFLTALTVFSFCQIISGRTVAPMSCSELMADTEKASEKKQKRRRDLESGTNQRDTTSSEDGAGPEKKSLVVIQEEPMIPTPTEREQNPMEITSSPLLGRGSTFKSSTGRSSLTAASAASKNK